MRMINGVNFYDCSDALYTHSAILAMDSELKPIGVFLPAVKGFTAESSVNDLKEDSTQLREITDAYNALVGA